ncbi:hypothetical protein [Nonomuraea sp. NPDC049141]|uniref:hypothetical protein n=1 Tax=Nonomuraea sp. NPDC049141 TaxID=3155500 RepID=UPI0033F88B63
MDIEPGIAFASDDSDGSSAIVAYDSEDAAIRYASLVVRVDKVLAGQLGQGYADGKIRLQVEHPATSTLAELKDSIGTAGTGLMYVHNLAARRQLIGRPVTDPAQYVPEDETEPTPTSTCDDDLCPQPTGKPDATATSVPAGEPETAPTATATPTAGTAPTLSALRTRLVASSCAEGTAADSSAC